MPQNLILLPKSADFEILGWPVKIQNHRAVHTDSLFTSISSIINKSTPGSIQTLVEFEKHKVSYEAVIEYCADEFENDVDVLTSVIRDYLIPEIKDIDNTQQWRVIHNFSKSMTGRSIAVMYIEKIRSCENWSELYEEMHYASRFNQDMKNRITAEMEQTIMENASPCMRR